MNRIVGILRYNTVTRVLDDSIRMVAAWQTAFWVLVGGNRAPYTMMRPRYVWLGPCRLGPFAGLARYGKPGGMACRLQKE